jgi:predicted phosphodiesterase
MKIQYASDLHLQIQSNREYLRQNPIEPVGDVLVLAGDITKMHKSYYSDEIFDYFSKNWKLVIVVPGNHEYYHNNDLNAINRTVIKENLRDNVLLVNNEIVKYEDVNFICAVLWSYISPSNMFAVTRGLSDFYVISGKVGRKSMVMNGDWFNRLHSEAKAFLHDALTTHKGEKNVVVTHHGPTQLINHPDFKGSPINQGFIVELYDYIKDFDISHWIYGHTHRNIDKEIEGTQVICNQLGYVSYGENFSYKPNKFFEI